MKDKLLEFGDLFIKEVRDNTLFVLEGIISGHMKSSLDQKMHMDIKTMSEENRELLREMAYRMVDLSLHNMLLLFESNQEWVISHKNDIQSLAETSDGLAGELYTSDGWIHKFSEYPLSKGLGGNG